MIHSSSSKKLSPFKIEASGSDWREVIETLKERMLGETAPEVPENVTFSETRSLLDALSDPEGRVEVYELADRIRARFMGENVFLRGIVELSNICIKACNYCGIRAGNSEVTRYRIPDDEVIAACQKMKSSGQTTVVLQSGEDSWYTREKFGELLLRIKRETGLAITVSVGERDSDTFRFWKECGMDRYLIRFETSNREVFAAMHPDDDFDERIQCIRNLKSLGVQTGSGFMIGLPGTSLDDLARDILFCRELDLDMVGVGPFIPHPSTPAGAYEGMSDLNFLTGVIAVLRIVNFDAHIPATTAFDAIDPSQGRQLVLQRGANVFMPNSTPGKYRASYLLYPNKPCVDESADDCAGCVMGRILSIGRQIGTGPGHSMRLKRL